MGQCEVAAGRDRGCPKCSPEIVGVPDVRRQMFAGVRDVRVPVVAPDVRRRCPSCWLQLLQLLYVYRGCPSYFSSCCSCCTSIVGVPVISVVVRQLLSVWPVVVPVVAFAVTEGERCSEQSENGRRQRVKGTCALQSDDSSGPSSASFSASVPLSNSDQRMPISPHGEIDQFSGRLPNMLAKMMSVCSTAPRSLLP